MGRFKNPIPIDDYVIDVLMRDLVGHDKQPAAFLVYLWLSGQAARSEWASVAASLGRIAEETGLSKSAVQTAVSTLHRRALVTSARTHRTATPDHSVLRPWRDRL